MTKAELQKSHDAMVKFLTHLCKFSDEHWLGYREPICEEHYQKARRLIKQAGVKYAPK